MRSMTPSGIVLRSVDAGTPLAEEPLTQRTPSTRTSTRFEPRKRRSASVAPAPMPPPSGGYPKLPLELYLLLIAPPETGSCCRMSPTDDRPVRSMSSRDIINTGACLPSGSLIRDPVTTMTSVPTGGASSAVTAAPCAGVAPGLAGASTPAAGAASGVGAGESGASGEDGGGAGASGGSGGAGGDAGGAAGCAAPAAVVTVVVCGAAAACASRRGPGRIRSVGSALAVLPA